MRRSAGRRQQCNPHHQACERAFLGLHVTLSVINVVSATSCPHSETEGRTREKQIQKEGRILLQCLKVYTPSPLSHSRYHFASTPLPPPAPPQHPHSHVLPLPLPLALPTSAPSHPKEVRPPVVKLPDAIGEGSEGVPPLRPHRLPGHLLDDCDVRGRHGHVRGEELVQELREREEGEGGKRR